MTDLTPYFSAILESLYRPAAKAFDSQEPRDAGGRWSKVWEHDPERKVRVVKLESAPMAGAEQTKELARPWALKNLPGTYKNEDTGWSVDVPTNGIKEALSHLNWKSPAAIQTIAAIPELIRVAVPIQSEPDKKERPAIIQVHTLIAPILVEGEIRRARMTVRETNMGQKYYGHRLEDLEIERSGALPEGPHPEGRWAVSQHPDTIKIGALLKGFNPHEGEKP